MDFEFLIPISIFLMIAYIVKTNSDNKIKKMLIEKGQIDENLKYLYASNKIPQKYNALKWGIVAMAIGLSLLITKDYDEKVILATMITAGGLALLIYYLISSHLEKDKQ